MKTFIYKLFLLSTLIAITSCSTSDNSNDEQMDEGNEQVHATLRINGSGFSDEVIELTRENIEDLGGSIRVSARKNDGSRMTFRLPAPIEKVQYSIIDYNNTKDNISSVTVAGTGIFLSKDGGRLTITDIVENGDCTTYKGSFSIDYRRQDNSPGEINVQGSFEMPTEACN